MKYLLDTNICVYLLRGKYDMDKVIKKVGLDNCAISEITAFELIVGAELLRQKTGTDQVSQVQHFVTENIKDFKDIKSISLENWVRRNNP